MPPPPALFAMSNTPRRVKPAWVALMAALALPVPGAAQESETLLSAEHVSDLAPRLIGPGNPSGRVTALAATPQDGYKTLYAGFASSGVWKSENAGTTWEPIFDGEGSATVGDVAVAPSDADVVWVGTGERNSLRSNQWGDGIYRSSDGGDSWEHMGLTETRQIGRIAIHPTDPNTVLVAALGHLWGPNADRGIYRTTDGGENWEQVLFVNDTTGFVDLRFAPDDPNTLYAASWHRLRWGGGRMEGAGAGSGIWKSTDGGTTWVNLTEPGGDRGLPTDRMGRIGLATSLSDPAVLYAVMQVSQATFSAQVSTYGGVFRSDDRGESWRRVHDISANPDYYYNEVFVDPNDVDHVWLGATLMFESTDGGETFEAKRFRRVHVDNHALWIDPGDSEHMVLGNDGGIYITWDGGDHWRHNEIPASQLYEVDVDTTKIPYHVCGGHQDNGTWCGPSATRERVGITTGDWYSVFGGDGFHSAVSPDDPTIRFGESQYGNVQRLDTDTMERVGIKPEAEDAGVESGYPFRWDWDTPFIISHHDPTVVYLGGNHLFRMRDRARDWETLGPDMTRGNRFAPEPDSGHTAYRSLHSIAESTLDANVLWTGSNDGLIWVTRDGGVTWANVTENIPQEQPKRCFVAEIEASNFDPASAYVAYDCHRRDDYRPYVFVTHDGGATWSDITGDLPAEGGSFVVRQDFINRGLLFVGTERGLWVSNEGGNHWVRIEKGLPTVPVRDMEIVRRTRELVVGSYGRGAYVIGLAGLQGLTPEAMATPGQLFDVLPARQFVTSSTYGSFGDGRFLAANPDYGAAIYYYLRDDQDGQVTLTVRQVESDETVRTLRGSGDAGLHRIVWDLESSEARPRRLGDPTSQNDLQRVLPGEYEVSFDIGGETMTRTVTVEEGWVEQSPGALR